MAEPLEPAQQTLDIPGIMQEVGQHDHVEHGIQVRKIVRVGHDKALDGVLAPGDVDHRFREIDADPFRRLEGSE
jgi:hypothetical protein